MFRTMPVGLLFTKPLKEPTSRLCSFFSTRLVTYSGSIQDYLNEKQVQHFSVSQRKMPERKYVLQALSYKQSQGAATDVPDGEGSTSVHTAVSGNCKVSTKEQEEL